MTVDLSGVQPVRVRDGSRTASVRVRTPEAVEKDKTIETQRQREKRKDRRMEEQRQQMEL